MYIGRNKNFHLIPKLFGKNETLLEINLDTKKY